ncbi:MAG TPA: HAMP domain-containing sensor histidine kinase [Solirubrobacteraceae bacterium]|jgi:signal transduction histidine kinase|nr:HAMP domain-containing sensor histidine kinase [Solirubrobacteraceae bacterium]
MNVAARLNSRITQLAVGRHLPYRTVRMRLTLLYGGLFVISGAALMAIAYTLLVNAGFVFTLQSSGSSPSSTGSAAAVFPAAGSTTHPSAQTMAHWRGVAVCMRAHGVPQFPNPTTSVPASFRALPRQVRTAVLPKFGRYSMVSDRDGAIMAIPAAASPGSSAFTRASDACGFQPDKTGFAARDDRRRTQVRQQLLLQSGIALAGMALLSLGLGWLIAGRVLQPLQDSYDAQRQFVANASHELRAPLTRQRALIEVALASPDADSASLRRAHERVLASEQHLEQLIDALLALTRGQAGLERRERFDLAALATRALHAQSSEADSLGLDVHATLEPAPTAGDSRLLERLITNLIDNAIHHNSPGGHIEIATGTRDRQAYVSVANSGPTIRPEEITRLFQPFERLSSARAHHDRGHGLGLSIVEAIAAAHCAELRARPQPGGGLVIHVSFAPASARHSRLSFITSWVRRGRPRARLQD